MDEAIKLYEKNIAENFDGNHPYNPLTIIYRKREQIDDEIRVLNKAINVFENLDAAKLQRFKDRLKKAHKLKSKDKKFNDNYSNYCINYANIAEQKIQILPIIVKNVVKS